MLDTTLASKINTTSFVTVIRSLIDMLDELIDDKEKGKISNYTLRETNKRIGSASVDSRFISDNCFFFCAFNEAEYLKLLYTARVLGFKITPIKGEVNFPVRVSFSFYDIDSFGHSVVANEGFPCYTQEEYQKRFDTFFAATMKVCESNGIEIPEFDLGVERYIQYTI
jgi:hypothetical protein